ncbi:LOW QUALITY PROTEIN: gamma-tubulin complex component 6-like [Sitophilus oryzae]|uniref:Gamma-tubulin complex component 6 n=1 Tax=Sitophilus oryzae TaxID=7048 RepID=A0A6J2Y099_SITOR|nr:LOW QUALITY PROTEIN: gamma-tubulin complex component 6-like [Sitophilus oryzae]
MEDTNDSVFDLITSLCEKFCVNDSRKARILRSNCYELLLGKKSYKNPRKFNDLEGSSDPVINLQAWCYTLINNYDFAEEALELQEHTEKLKAYYSNDVSSFNSLLTFLLCLKNIPKKDSKKLNLSTLPEIDDEMLNLSSIFKLPASLQNEANMSSIFKLDDKMKRISSDKLHNSLKDTRVESNIFQDEGYSSPQKQNIWDVVMSTRYSNRKSWESYGCGVPDKERPFLSELGELSSLWVENLESLYLANNMFPSFTIITNKMKPKKHFIRDLKYLLVGMPSETFNLNSREEFFLSSGMLVDGITPDAIERYSSEFLFSGSCYRALKQMVTPDPTTRKYKHSGYVFTEFCESLARYLQFYRTAVISIPDVTNYLTFYEKTHELQRQILTLTSICKVGPYACDAVEMPHGVALLNYLYQKVLDVIDKNLSMVLYSILYPCCQTYFSRFLHQWILKGSINDPYGEFFITSNVKFLSTRGRTYWTRSYEIRQDLVPDFLLDIKGSILFCGRIINLLYLCTPMNKLCIYLMGKNPLLFSCCLSHTQLNQLEQCCARYFLEASTECGSKFSFKNTISRSLEDDIAYVNLIAKRRAITLKRIELERQKVKQEEYERKMEEFMSLKEQYETAFEQKQLKIYREIEKEIKHMQEEIEIETMRDNLISEEANKMINYYSELYEAVENRNKKINSYMNNIKNIHIDSLLIDKDNLKNSTETDKQNSSSESFYSIPDDTENKMETLEEPKPVVHSSESMDLLNANVEGNKTENPIETEFKTTIKETQTPVDAELKTTNPNLQQTIENFQLARKIKQKVLNQEMGISTFFCQDVKQVELHPQISNLTAAQRNKLKVLSSEFGIDVIKEHVKTDRVLTMAQINRSKILGHQDTVFGNFSEARLDNENFVNKNEKNSDNTLNEAKAPSPIKKSKSLHLNFEKSNSKVDLDKPVPMSVDSTPLSDLPVLATPLSDYPRSVTPSSMFLSVETKMDSLPNTADVQRSNTSFSYVSDNQFGNISYHYNKKSEDHGSIKFSKRVTREEAKTVTKNCLKLLLHESVSIPLLTQLKLANNEILKYFIEELKYLKHLESLRSYFFLQDGEFGRNITENLFEKLYNANFPLELINCRTLQHLVFSALDNSSRFQENSNYLSFKINSLPKCFDLGDPDVLDCLSLTYKVKWPLNILLPSDTVSKYDQVFKFLVKLNRVSWVLKKIFLELKVLAKETGKKEIYLMSSPQYRKLHQCRHVMSHFMQTFQNYIVGEVLQPSWELFERSLEHVTNLDELYSAHITYIKNILFRCMLNQKSVALRNIIQKIFIVMIKFYDYLRSRHWVCEDGLYVHPNFSKLDKIFKNFEDFVVYFFKVAQKVTKSGYQPFLIQFLDVLNVNDYYSKKLLKNT